MNHRAYALLNVKGVVEKADEWVIEGIASTPTTDRMGDVVEPLGARFKLPMPLLWQHNSEQPVGRVEFAKPTAKGIPYVAHLPKIAEAGTLKNRVDEAVQSIKYRLVAAVSIGFRGIEGAIENLKEGGLRFKEWEWLELSLVTIPANAEATITSIKSLDSAQRAATGHPTRGKPPGDTGTKQAASSGGFFNPRSKGTTVKTLQDLREERATKSARMKELVDLFGTAGHEASDEETSEFDGLAEEVKTLDQDIRIATFHATQGAAAKAVDGSSQKAGTASRGGLSFVRKQDPDDKFEGQSYIKMLKLKALSRVKQEPLAALADLYYGKSHPKFVRVVKAAVAGGGTDSGEWGAELLSLNAQYEGDFIEYLYAKTLFDQLPLREAPANARIKGQDGAATANWVGQSRAIPVSAQDYSTIDLVPLKVAALCVLSNELIEDSSPAADRLARDSLVEASSQKVDSTFFSTTAASSGVSPAGMLNGLTAIQASGTDEAAVRTDMQALLYPFVVAKMASGIVICMNPAQGLALGSMINTFSMPSFPGLNETGGMFGGRKVYAGDNVTAGQIIALRPADIWKIGDGGVQISSSDVATIEMNDGPAGRSDTPVAMASHTVSMYQTESTAFKVVRRINFQKRRSNAVVYIDNAEYGGVAS